MTTQARHIKSIALSTTLSLTLMLPALATGAENNDTNVAPDCSIVQNAAAAAADETQKIADIVYEEHLKSVDREMWEQCLSGIVKPGWGVSLGIPDVDQLFNAACRRARSEINDRLRELSGAISVDALEGAVGVEAKGGAVGRTSGVKIQDTSSRVARKVLNNI